MSDLQLVPVADLCLEWIQQGCLVEGLSNERYHDTVGASKSSLDLVSKSGMHYACRGDFSSTRAMDMGTAIHAAILEPALFAAEFHLTGAKDRRSKEYKAAAEQYGADRVFTAAESEKIRGMQKAIAEQLPHLGTVKGWRELSAFATDPETGVHVRCRFDLLTEDLVAIDLKKTQDARAEAFSRTVATYRYHVQAAFYGFVFYLATGKKLKAFRFAAVEENAPHTAVEYQLDDDALAFGEMLFRRDLKAFAACEAANKWDYYKPESTILSLPNWAMAEYENALDEAMEINLENAA